MNNEINRLHERCVMIIYNDKTLPFPDLLRDDGSVTKQTRNFATEIFKTELMHWLFSGRQTHCNWRNPHHFTIPSINSVYHGSENISNLGPRIWNVVSDRLKELNSISSFKSEI